MNIKVFFVADVDDESFQEEINKFIASVRVASIERQYSPSREGWSVFITYSQKLQNYDNKRDHVDYKTVLSQDEYERFLKLKEIRKEIYRREGVAAYMIFTDDELAEISKCSNFSKESYGSLNIKRKRLEKYGDYFIERLKEYESSGKSDGEDMHTAES